MHLRLGHREQIFSYLLTTNYSDKFTTIFLLTHEYYLNSLTILRELLNIFDNPEVLPGSISITKERILDILKLWITLRYNDTSNEIWSTAIKAFINSLKNSSEKKERIWYRKVSDITNERYDSKLKRSYSTTVSVPALDFKKETHEELVTIPQNILDLDPYIVAVHMTMKDDSLFKKIEIKEYFDRGWNDPDTNLYKFIEHFNEVSFWIQTEIVKLPNVKDRSLAIGIFIDIAMELKQLRNYHGIMEVLSALSSLAVGRLKNSWKFLPSKSTANHRALEKLMNSRHSYSLYRQEIASIRSNTPALLFHGTIMQDLNLIEEQETFTNGMVNWHKMDSLSKVFLQIVNRRKVQYYLTIDPKDNTLIYLKKAQVITSD
eukprot:TRINITY_DN6790_c0_g1_i7.p1 TRINITY_DN6790_c0_g1~~TRINITY_DN6790_c0_g1_i7.p1  ORF type:complete len:375 (-),score=40.86 TRINITY_DN6790_c0_g1_i7:520-1644(-)